MLGETSCALQHTNGWLRNCSAGTNQVLPAKEEAEKLTLQVCRVLRLLSFPGTRVFQPPLSTKLPGLERLRGHCLEIQQLCIQLLFTVILPVSCFIFLVNSNFSTYIYLHLSLFTGAKGRVKLKGDVINFGMSALLNCPKQRQCLGNTPLHLLEVYDEGPSL